jgi:hypothetical protein
MFGEPTTYPQQLPHTSGTAPSKSNSCPNSESTQHPPGYTWAIQGPVARHEYIQQENCRQKPEDWSLEGRIQSTEIIEKTSTLLNKEEI